MKQTEGTRCAVWPDGNDPYYPGGQCGLVIGVRGRKLLLDGLHSQENGMFSPVPPCIREQIMKRIPPFDGIRWVALPIFMRIILIWTW